jgi:hypothetical protein
MDFTSYCRLFRHCHPECSVERPGVSKRRPRWLGERLHAAQGDGERSEEEVTDALGLASKILVTAAAIASEVRRSWAANWSLISASSSAETAPRKDDWASCPQAGGPACGPWGSVRRLLPRSGRSRSSRVCCHRLFWKSAGSLVLRLTIIIIFFRFVFCEKKAPNDSRFFARKRCEYLWLSCFRKTTDFCDMEAHPRVQESTWSYGRSPWSRRFSPWSQGGSPWSCKAHFGAMGYP